MGLSEAGRAQSNVVGAILLFGFLILAIAVYQAQVVPADNAQVEFEHSQLVENDAVDLRNAIVNTGHSGESRSASVKLGTRYPQRTFFVNPPPATGSVTTSDSEQIRIENASVDADGNVGAYWEDRELNFTTRSVRYSSDYNVYGEAPDLVYEHSMLLADFDGAVLSRTGQSAVRADPNRVSLTLVEGNLSRSGIERAEFDTDPLSKSERSIRLVPDDDVVSLILPTNVDVEDAERAADLEQRWEEQLGANATANVTDGAVHVTIETEDPIRLRLSQVSLGSDVSEPEPAYLTGVAGSGGSPVVEVRDEFNNPVEGAKVNVKVNDDERNPVVTDEDGRAEYQIDTDDPLRPTVRMFINESYEGSEEWERKRFRSVTGGGSGGGGGGGGGNVNPGEEGDVVLSDVGIRNGKRVVDLQFRNEGDEERSLEMMQFTLYYSPQGDTQDSVAIQETGQEFQLRGSFDELDEPLVIPEGETATLTLEFDDNAAEDLLGVSFVTDENREAMYLTGLDGTVEPEPNFEVTIDETNSPVEENDTLTVTATAENTGTETDTQSLELEIDGEIRDSTDEFELEPDESNQETLEWETEEGDAGEYTAIVRSENSTDEVDVEVVEEGDPAGNVDLQDEILTNDDDFDVDWQAQNTGGEATLVVVNVDEGEEVKIDVGDGDDTETITAGDVGGLNNGDTIEATLYESDGPENELDSDTTEVSTPTGPFYPTDSNVNAGQLNDFENLQDADGQVAEFRRERGNNFDIDIITEDVPAGEYVLEIEVTTADLGGQRNFEVTVTGSEDGGLGDTTLEEEGTITIPVNISEKQDITVNYLAEGNDGLDIDYQRIEDD